jgi:hypothetical protein
VGTVETAISSGDPATCATCHVPKVTVQHGDIDHTTYDPEVDTYGAVDQDTHCTECHYGQTGSKTDDFHIYIIHDVNDAVKNPSGTNDCSVCHLTAGGAGELRNYSGGGSTLGDNIDYEGINSGHGGICKTCHTPYADAGVSSAHNVKEHGLLGNQNECNGCHTAVDGSAVAGIHPGCSTCHDTATTDQEYWMKPLSSAANHTYGALDTCSDCHSGATNEFDANVGTRTTVHSTGGIETHASALDSASNCTTNCHSGDIQTGVHAPNGGCQNCHASAFDGSFVTLTYGNSANHTKGGVSSCTDCHGNGVGDPIDYANNFSAHNSTISNARHNTRLLTTGAPQCTSCHTAANGTEVRDNIHALNTCDNCHINTTTDGSFQDGTETDSALLGAVAGNATLHSVGFDSNCTVCHTAYNNDFNNHDDTIMISRHNSFVTGNGAPECTSCHGGDVISAVHKGWCQHCHTDTEAPGTDGTLHAGDTAASYDGNTIHGRADLHNIGLESNCLSCHSAHDTSFSNHDVPTGDTHATRFLTAGVSQCTSCHGTADVVLTIHNNNCENCHVDRVNDGSLHAGDVTDSVNSTLSSGNATLFPIGQNRICTICHDVLGGDFTAHRADTHDNALYNYNDTTWPTQDCDNCHTATNATFEVRDTIHAANTCDNCHEDAITTKLDGSLRIGAKGDATAHLVGGLGSTSDCTTCHGLTYFNLHDYGLDHTQIYYDPAGLDTLQGAPDDDDDDTSQSPPQGCADCHDPLSNTLGTWAAIKAEHTAYGDLDNSCRRCHDYDENKLNGKKNTVLVTDVAAAMTNGTDNTCDSCHEDKTPDAPHGTHEVTDWATNESATDCASCHTGDVVTDVHGDNCSYCHLASAGGDTSFIGSAANLDIPTTHTKPHDCTDCHTGGATDHVALHHGTDTAILGRCDICHGDGTGHMDTAVAPRQLMCVKCHINDDTGSNTLEIVAYDLTLADARQAVDIQTGAVTSPVNHSIAYGSNPATQIYDFRACFDCHDGQNPNYDPVTYTKVVVKPFHGYPGDWTVERIDAGNAAVGYPSGISDLTTPDEIVLFYQYYHPGPGVFRGGVRRFSSIMANRMGTDNKDLYKSLTGTNTYTNPDMGHEAIGKNGTFTFDNGNPGITGGLGSQFSDGTVFDGNPGYSTTFNATCAGVYGWCSDGEYSNVPANADIASADIITITKAEYDKDGTGDLTIEATNVSGNLSISAFSPALGGDCSTGGMTGSAPSWSYTCTPAVFTPDGTQTVTVTSSATSIDATRIINNSSGAGAPVTNTLGLVTANWYSSGDGATTGLLRITARVSDDQNTPQYMVNYDSPTGTDYTDANLTWIGGNTQWEDFGAYTGTDCGDVPGNNCTNQVYIHSGGLADDAYYDVLNDSDEVLTITGPGTGSVATYDDATETLTVWATHRYGDGNNPATGGSPMVYEANYNGTDYTMTWNGTNSRYELVQAGVGVYNTDVTVHSSEEGGHSLQVSNVEDVSVTNYTLAYQKAEWRSNGDGIDPGQLVVCLTSDPSYDGGTCSYTLDYNSAPQGSLTWNTVATANCGANEYEGVISNVNWGVALLVEVQGSPANCDGYRAIIPTDETDIIDVTQADHNGSDLIVTANLTNDGTCPRNYIVTYELTDSVNMACATDTPAPGQSQYTITWSGAPAFNGGSATVHANVAYGDSGSRTVQDTAVGEAFPGTFSSHATYVRWGDLEGTPVDGEGCFHCHDDVGRNKDVILDVHNADCWLCHATNPPTTQLIAGSARGKDLNQDGVLTDGAEHNPLDISQSNDGMGPGTCTSCHKGFMSQKGGVDLRFKTWNHHLSENAQAGNCVHCHDSVRTTPVGQSWCVVEGSRVPRQPPCAYCHVDADKAYGNTVAPLEDVSDGTWRLQYFDFLADGFNTPLTKLTSTTHSIPNVAGGTAEPVVIHDFAVCFECHDTTDMMDGMVDGNSNPIVNPTSDPNNDPNKVYPYHASGMSLALGGAMQQADDPLTYTWFPINRSTGYNATNTVNERSEAWHDDVANGGTPHGANSSGDGTNTIADDGVYFGPGVSDDMFFAYHYHPGRGGIVGTSTVIGGVSAQAGSFNILFPIMTFNLSNTPQYYKDGAEVSSKTIKNFYQNGSKAYNTDYHAGNFGTGGSSSPTYTPNNSYTDQYGKHWDFSLQTNVPYTDYKIGPVAANDVYWSTVPYFDETLTPFPTMNDEVRLLRVDCNGPVVEAWSKLSGDFWANGTVWGNQGDGGTLPNTPSDGDLYLQVDTTGVGDSYGANENMTWDGTKWSVAPSSCASGDLLRITSDIGQTASDSVTFTVP